MSVVRTVQAYGVPSRYGEDVAQDVFAAVLRSLPRYDPRRPFRPWLYTIAYRTARDFLRLQINQRERLMDDDMDNYASDAPDPEARQAQRDAQALFRKIVRTMDDDLRQVFLMYEVDEFTVPEISTALELPASTVTSRLRCARREFDAAARRMRASPAFRRGGACVVPIALFDPQRLIEAGRVLPDVSSEMQARVWGRVMRATYAGPVRSVARLAMLTPNQIAGAIGGALLLGAASGLGIAAALFHWQRVPGEPHERAVLLTATNDSAARPNTGSAAAASARSSGALPTPTPPSSIAAAASSAGAVVAAANPRSERALLQHARAALDAGYTSVALEDLASLAERFPDSAYSAEREAIERRAFAQFTAQP